MLRLDVTAISNMRWLHCDRCGNVYRYYRQVNLKSGAQARSVRLHAKRDGWQRKRMKDICPSCLAAWKSLH